MPAPGRILRPRHLFPEVATVWIQFRRMLLRVSWCFGRLELWFPPWAAGMATGTVGIMLAILLFFIRDPGVAAERLTDTVPAPLIPQAPLNESVVEPRPTPVIDDPLPRPDLRFEFTRTWLSARWDQEKTSVSTSRPEPDAPEWSSTPVSEFWTTTIPFREREQGFSPYVLQGRAVPAHEDKIPTSNHPGPVTVGTNPQRAGLELTRVVPDSATSGEEFRYEILVRNTTPDSIGDVLVRERMSAIDRVIAVAPAAAVLGDELVWSLGEMPPGDQRKLSVTVVAPSAAPTSSEEKEGAGAEGVREFFETQATLSATTRVATTATMVRERGVSVPSVLDLPRPVRALIADEAVSPAATTQPPQPLRPPARPILKLSATPVSALTQGDRLTVVYTVSNAGNQKAQGVEIFVRLSDQFQHRHGNLVRHGIAELEPGQSHRAVLRAVAAVSGDASLDASLAWQGRQHQHTATNIHIAKRPGQPPE